MLIVRFEFENINTIRLLTEALIKYVKDVKEITGNDIDKYFPGADLAGLYNMLGSCTKLMTMKEEEKENEKH